MKLQNYLLAIAVISFTAGISSCKKDNNSGSDSTEIASTVELSGDQAISDNLNADAENVLNEAAVDNNFSGSRTTGVTSTMNLLKCATVTVSAGAFPKTIVIDFGTGSGCTPSDGIIRSGKINVLLSDSLRKSGSVATMTFDNYYVGGYKKEGTVSWTNTSTADVKSWTRVCAGGKITGPNGQYWLHSGSQILIQTEGSSTSLDLLDDVYTVTGSHTVTNDAGVTRTSVITSALEKKTICANIDKGTIKIQGPKHYAVIDYGDGTCDRIATISVDGSNPIQFLLRN